MLLIDEIDRADQEFEGFLLELLAEFQVTVPELGTIRAGAPPLVILTSNRTREVHDALKRRCLYQWIEYPSFEKELAIVSRRAPEASQTLARQVTAAVQELRASDLYKKPGVSETIRLARRARRARRARARREPSSTRRSASCSKRRKISTRYASAAHRTSSIGPWRVPQFLDSVLAFGRALRDAGVDVHLGRLLDVVEALGHVNLAARDEVYHTCRTLLVHGPEQIPTFDRTFDAFWRGTRDPPSLVGNRRERPRPAVTAVESVVGDPVDDTDAPPAGHRSRRPGAIAAASPTETSPSARPTSSPASPSRSRRCGGRPASVARTAGLPAAVGASTCGAPLRRAGGPAATSRRCRVAATGRGPGRSSFSATSAVRWNGIRGCCCCSRTH